MRDPSPATPAAIAEPSYTGPLKVACLSMPNPDFGQITNPAPDEMATVSTLADARAACLAYIEKHGLGGGNWRGGQVFDLTGNKIAYVSYNGRVWTGEEWPACPEIVLSQPADPPPTA